MVDSGANQMVSASRWNKIFSKGDECRQQNKNHIHTSRVVMQAVKVFSESTQIFKQECTISLTPGACPQNDKSRLSKAVQRGRGSDITKSVFCNKTDEDEDTQSDMSSLTASTGSSDENWTRMKPTDKHLEEEESLVMCGKRSLKSALKIKTQDESKKNIYGSVTISENSVSPAIVPPPFMENFFVDCCYQNDDAKDSPDDSISHLIESEEHKCENSTARPPKVQFSIVETHYHLQTLGDQLTVKQGPPVSLGDFMATSTMSVKKFEVGRKRTIARARDLLIPCEQRREILLRAGVPKSEINKCESSIQMEREELATSKCVDQTSKPRQRSNKEKGTVSIDQLGGFSSSLKVWSWRRRKGSSKVTLKK